MNYCKHHNNLIIIPGTYKKNIWLVCPYRIFEYKIIICLSPSCYGNNMITCRWVRMADLRSVVRQACQQVSCDDIRARTLPTGVTVCI